MTVLLSGVHTVTLDALSIPKQFVAKLRRADDFIRLGVAAAAGVYPEVAGEDVFDPTRSGLVVGSCYGPMQTNFDVLELITSGQQTSPTLFSHSVFNSATGYLSALLGMCGPGQTITDFVCPFFQSLREGWLAVHSGIVDRCMVLQIETYSALLEDGRNDRAQKQKIAAWPLGAVCWLLERQPEKSGDSLELTLPEIQIDGYPEPEHLLLHRERLLIGEKVTEVDHPLGVPMAVSEVIKELSGEQQVPMVIEGDWGRARFTIAGKNNELVD